MRNLVMSKSDIGFLTAYKLRQDLGINPNEYIDLNYVAEQLMIRVIRMYLGDGVEGACKSKGIKRLVALTPTPSSPQKERFTYSHEIGHLLIHHSSYVCLQDFFNTYKTQNDEEQEANDFAAELLLPRRALLDILTKRDLTFKLIEQVSKKFGTSLSVAAIQLIRSFNDNAVIIWHDGQHLLWKVRSDHCTLDISEAISPMVLANKTSDNRRDIKGNIDSQFWIENEIDNLICEEETHYFKNLKKYLTILKFYEEY